MAKKTRALRREAERKAQKLNRDLERLAGLSIGGAPERPFKITAPSEVEVHVESAKCPLCEGRLKLEEHAAETIEGSRLRIARVVCDRCGVRRAIYFQLASAAAN